MFTIINITIIITIYTITAFTPIKTFFINIRIIKNIIIIINIVIEIIVINIIIIIIIVVIIIIMN